MIGRSFQRLPLTRKFAGSCRDTPQPIRFWKSVSFLYQRYTGYCFIRNRVPLMWICFVTMRPKGLALQLRERLSGQPFESWWRVEKMSWPFSDRKNLFGICRSSPGNPRQLYAFLPFQRKPWLNLRIYQTVKPLFMILKAVGCSPAVSWI